MEFCQHGDLYDFLGRKGQQLNKKDLTEIEIRYYFSQILEAFKYLRKNNLIHRDVKPQNILVNNNVLKVADFGFAKEVKEKEIEKSYKGTLTTLSPQVLQGNYTHKCDIYSLGCTLYWIMYNDYPYMQYMKNQVQLVEIQKKNPVKCPDKPNYSEDLKKICERMLIYKEEDRISWEELFESSLFNQRLILETGKINILNVINYDNIKEKEVKDMWTGLNIIEYDEKQLDEAQNQAEEYIQKIEEKQKISEVFYMLLKRIEFEKGKASFLRKVLERINDYSVNGKEKPDVGLEVSWQYKFEIEQEKVWFSFTYPFSYEENQEILSYYENKYQDDSLIYFNRSILSHSLEKRNIELITITSHKNKEIENFEKQSFFVSQNPPYIFKKKKYIFLSARVHPGEVPGSHVLNGIIKQLLNKKDQRSQILLDNFVFYIVPMINPDGVYRGYYRTDTQGLNLNRFYINPSIQNHPSVYSIKQLVVNLSETKRLCSYIDLHAHAGQKGIFMYGNCVDLKNQVHTCLFPRLVAINSPYFDYEACNFTEKNMYIKDKGDGLSKEGAGRVALYKVIFCQFIYYKQNKKATKLNLFYTLECNYNTGNIINLLVQQQYRQQDLGLQQNKIYDKDIIIKNLDQKIQKSSVFYTPEIYEQVGEALCDSFLDYYKLHPYSRIPNTVYQTLANYYRYFRQIKEIESQ
ncbi:zinc carboxypeptidase family protein, putative [Ichthyophthirius multifiliis]|uniref:tubulin-glutamate carboxypeptidase n=1 Tax=Ichthyophthirius multifiliis TaxID=5932 RepID=G0QNT4_ICHMU|nr:zinc carboxypeptidase family protein, putative [Ichthyophthirius multifiliis]EGR33125.1 zinc carboxypeptidase family protein, putative [Ichthyophthirius multifiliis]|eukprot:XP_004037111.1 zinc carboxypeptidase family protein, putative [Ichthyophthirius multifiliis]